MTTARPRPRPRPTPEPATHAELLDLADPRWADYVAGHPDATPFHLPAWGRLVADCYGFRSFALALATDSGRIAGGLPVVEVRRPWGRRWVSLPFTDHCPPLADPVGSAVPLRQAARSALLAHGARRLQVRADVPDAAPVDVAVRHVLALEDDPDAMFRQFHKSQVQRNIRRSEREGVTVRVGTHERDLTEVFYRLHLQTRRRQGVPVQPRRFFGLIWQRFLAQGHGSVLVAEHAGAPVAAAVFLRHNGTVVYKYGASDSDAWAVRPNHALFWHAIRTAVADGDRCLDWGRTDLGNDGLRAFKSAWGATELPLAYSTVGLGALARPAERDLGESAPARWAATVIRRSPAWVCTTLGETLYRYTA